MPIVSHGDTESEPSGVGHSWVREDSAADVNARGVTLVVVQQLHEKVGHHRIFSVAPKSGDVHTTRPYLSAARHVN